MKSLILAAAVLSTTAHAQPAPNKPPSGTITWNASATVPAEYIYGGRGDSALMIYQGGFAPVVTLKRDGTVEFGPGITPNEAALAFWRQVGHLVRERTCK